MPSPACHSIAAANQSAGVDLERWLMAAEDPPRPTLQMTVNPNSVAAPVHAAAVTCREIVDFYLDALAKAAQNIQFLDHAAFSRASGQTRHVAHREAVSAN